ncbi:UDP-3-O-(3-hydroxymyristoyl)glucosamine N-acyltransferase [Inediibacterium massiliense]|uniref:UDP-3-O-(3-hydroxymyristoyl)glucosamine N-acyltransferase n=1 Tax=Inediibacterium massiliense TaxID=1658111 RepID=UPI000B0FD9D3|nr:UDP-3-O-(3-hydroxymyristoyl)glucosamine N-acyltransferase [Inediibacterium massiliense]
MEKRRLSSILQMDKNIKVYKDGIYKSLGFIKEHEKEDLLVFLNDEKYLSDLEKNPNISCVICSENILEKIKDKDIGICIANDPKITFYRLHNDLVKNTEFYGKKFKSQISMTAQIHPTAYISDHNVIIKDGVKIEANVTILNDVYIGENTIIRAGCVIGTEGFQFARIENDILPISHAGKVIIHDHVEFQANCCVSKGIFGEATEIEEKCKFDNLVHIAHGVHMGKRCLVAANAMIAGYTTIGEDVWIGPSASISNMLDIGDEANIKIGAVVTKNVGDRQSVSGNFAIDHDRFISFLKSIR